MWFARLFGGRDDHDDYEEPTAAPPNVQRNADSESGVAGNRPSSASQPVLKRRAHDGVRPKGFDPYNSGTFQRRNAWERVNRR